LAVLAPTSVGAAPAGWDVTVQANCNARPSGSLLARASSTTGAPTVVATAADATTAVGGPWSWSVAGGSVPANVAVKSMTRPQPEAVPLIVRASVFWAGMTPWSHEPHLAR
jgi:hypothetical protein